MRVSHIRLWIPSPRDYIKITKLIDSRKTNYIRSSSWKGGNQSYSWEKKMSKHISESLKAVVTCMRHSGGILRIWRYSLETQWGSEDATKNRRRWIGLWEKSHAILLTSSLRLMFTVYLCEPWLWPRGIAAMTHNDGHFSSFLSVE